MRDRRMVGRLAVFDCRISTAEKHELLTLGLRPAWPPSGSRHPGRRSHASDCRPERGGSSLVEPFRGSGLGVGVVGFDGAAATAHPLLRAVQPVLHGVDYGLMLPALDPALLAGRALGFQRTLGALARPVAVQGHSLLRRREAPGQTLVGRTAIGVLFRDVDEVLFAEPARSLGS